MSQSVIFFLGATYKFPVECRSALGEWGKSVKDEICDDLGYIILENPI